MKKRCQQKSVLNIIVDSNSKECLTSPPPSLVPRQPEGEHLYLVNGEGEQHMELQGKVGFPFFGQLILDCLNRTENAMTQEHAFKAAELCLKAQAAAIRPG